MILAQLLHATVETSRYSIGVLAVVVVDRWRCQLADVSGSQELRAHGTEEHHRTITHSGRP